MPGTFAGYRAYAGEIVNLMALLTVRRIFGKFLVLRAAL